MRNWRQSSCCWMLLLVQLLPPAAPFALRFSSARSMKPSGLRNEDEDEDHNLSFFSSSTSSYALLPVEKTQSPRDALQYAANLLHQSDPSYNISAVLPSTAESVGTWHFNQLLFDLADHSQAQAFSEALARDLLHFMVETVRQAASHAKPPRDRDSLASNPVVPKPNADTVNAVLRVLMRAPHSRTGSTSNKAFRAEALLAQLATWNADGTLRGVRPDIVAYNTCINCWKESGIPGAAGRAQDILNLLECISDSNRVYKSKHRDSHGDDDDDDARRLGPDVVSYASCMGAWAEEAAAFGDSHAATRADELLMNMYQRSRDDRSRPTPNTRCFNAVLLAYANAKVVGGGKRALELLRFMDRLHSEGYLDVQPDSYTFNIVMKALTNCGEEGAALKASKILKRMEEAHCNGGDASVKPDLLSYNTVLDAFAKIGDGESAEALLNRMYQLADEGGGGEQGERGVLIIDKPNVYSYSAVLNAWARSEDKTRAVQRAEDLFNDLERRYASGRTDVRADTSVYNALINCWAKSGDRKTLYRVTQLLDLMEELGLRGGDSDVEPNSRTYCSVLDALARSKNRRAYNESLAILQRMEELYSAGYESVRPCARAYSIVISTVARSRKKGKAIKAWDILQRMESECQTGNLSACPTVYSYNAVLNAAAYTPRGDEIEQEEAFRVACLAFDRLRASNTLNPSHVSYGTFLKVIHVHMPSGKVRDDLVKKVFRRCCRDGQVGNLVLRNMKYLASPDLYQSLLEGESDYDLPKSWSANVKESSSHSFNSVVNT